MNNVNDLEEIIKNVPTIIVPDQTDPTKRTRYVMAKRFFSELDRDFSGFKTLKRARFDKIKTAAFKIQYTTLSGKKYEQFKTAYALTEAECAKYVSSLSKNNGLFKSTNKKQTPNFVTKTVTAQVPQPVTTVTIQPEQETPYLPTLEPPVNPKDTQMNMLASLRNKAIRCYVEELCRGYVQHILNKKQIDPNTPEVDKIKNEHRIARKMLYLAFKDQTNIELPLNQTKLTIQFIENFNKLDDLLQVAYNLYGKFKTV